MTFLKFAAYLCFCRIYRKERTSDAAVADEGTVHHELQPWRMLSTQTKASSAKDIEGAAACARCGAPLRATAYEVRGAKPSSWRCLRCALLQPPLIRRSLIIAIIVGTILTMINQGNLIVQGDVSVALAWKVPLTFAVPYCVATTGAILNVRSKRSAGTISSKGPEEDL